MTDQQADDKKQITPLAIVGILIVSCLVAVIGALGTYTLGVLISRKFQP